MTISQNTIKEATLKLVEAYQPVAVYLFGSYAWGTPNDDSDLDFMVVVDDEAILDKPKAKKGHIALRPINVSSDIMVIHKNMFEKASSHPSSLSFKVKSEGKLLFGNV